MSLVEHDDAADQVVQLAAARGASGKQALEELDIGGDDDRRVPVLAGETRAGGFLPIVEFGVAVVFDDVLVTEHGAEDVGRLFDDRGIGNGVDDPALVVRAMAWRSAKPRLARVLPPPVGTVKVKYAGWAIRFLMALAQDAAAQAIDRRVGAAAVSVAM